MAYGKQKIIDFKGAHLAKKMAMDGTNEQLISKVRQVLSTNFSKILKGFFEKIDDELFALSDKADNGLLQASYFDAMRYVRKERSRMQSCYLGLIEHRYDDFWSGKLQPAFEGVQAKEDEFSLVENEDLEEDLAIIAMVDKGENRYYRELYALNKRFAVLLKVDEIDKRQNPISPASLCLAFRSTLDPMTLDLEIKLVIYKLFDQLVLSKIGASYVELNALLVSQGVLPKIQNKVRKQPSASAPMPSASGETGEFSDDVALGGMDFTEEMNAEQLDFFRSLQDLVGGYRQRSDGDYSVATTGVQGPAYEMDEVMDILSMAQSNALNSPSPRPHGDSLKNYLTNTLGKLQPEGAVRPFASMDEDVIDMVGMIFDYLLEDESLPDPIKALLGRLQIPMLKAAILDKGFFARKGHPARELLNELSKAGSKLSVDDCEPLNPLYKEIKLIVEQVLDEFDQNSELFEQLLNELRGFLEKDEKRGQVLEGRTLQVTESKEKLLLAKKRVAYEVAKQMQGQKIPVIVKDFLEDSWRSVMVLAALRAEREPGGMERAVAVVGRLINSVTPPSSAEGKRKILRDLPLLIKEIRVGLESMSVDSYLIAGFFKDLERCHVENLKAVKAGRSEVNEEVVSLPEKSEEELERACEAAFEKLVLSAEESGDGELSPSDTGAFECEEIILSTESVSVDEVEENNSDIFADRAAEMEVGQWIELERDEEKIVRIKLSWKSQVTAMYVFVDRKGVKALEISQQGLAAELRRGSANLIEEVKAPLMDRALAAMVDTLKGHSPKQQEEVT
jgi:hypothetical protein